LRTLQLRADVGGPATDGQGRELQDPCVRRIELRHHRAPRWVIGCDFTRDSGHSQLLRKTMQQYAVFVRRSK
jgi:hypothetical protein